MNLTAVRSCGRLVAMAVAAMALPAQLRAQPLKPETLHEFECYVQSAEARMAARKAFLTAGADAVLDGHVVRGQRVETVLGNGANPHQIAGGQVYDWIGTVFIPGVSLERTIRMLQDYDHRARYFPEILSASKLLCRAGENHFRFTMRLKEPAVIDMENDVVWERVDPQRWRCSSYSTQVHEVGKDHRYLLRLYSYWRFAGVEKGVYVEGQTITLSGEFGSMTRALGSMMGINPEKSLKRTLTEMRESLLKPGMEFEAPPAGTAACGEAYRPGACAAEKGR
jgi:hypothetical protein